MRRTEDIRNGSAVGGEAWGRLARPPLAARPRFLRCGLRAWRTRRDRASRVRRTETDRGVLRGRQAAVVKAPISSDGLDHVPSAVTAKLPTYANVLERPRPKASSASSTSGQLLLHQLCKLLDKVNGCMLDEIVAPALVPFACATPDVDVAVTSPSIDQLATSHDIVRGIEIHRRGDRT